LNGDIARERMTLHEERVAIDKPLLFWDQLTYSDANTGYSLHVSVRSFAPHTPPRALRTLPES